MVHLNVIPTTDFTQHWFKAFPFLKLVWCSYFISVYWKLILCVSFWKIEPYFELVLEIQACTSSDKWLKGVFSIQRFSWYQGCFSNNLHFSSKRSSLTNVTWLLLLSIAKVFTSLMCFLYFTVTGTTYILAMLFFSFLVNRSTT